LEQKSERIQALLTKILSNLIKTDDNYSIQTPSLIVNHYVLNCSNYLNQLNQMHSSFRFRSLWNLKADCANAYITIKVNLFQIKIISFQQFTVKILFTFLVYFNTNGYMWTQR
jgi:hypothetical protein